MPPEIIDPNRRQSVIRETEMQMADVWSLGMLFFCLLNPDSKAPFLKEAVGQGKGGKDWQDFVENQISRGSMPDTSGVYEKLEATVWLQVHGTFLTCVKMNPTERPSLDKITSLLNEQEEALNFPFQIHQGTALENNQCTDSIFVHPANDGTNACMFLCLKICEFLLNNPVDGKWIELRSTIVQIIEKFPVL